MIRLVSVFVVLLIGAGLAMADVGEDTGELPDFDVLWDYNDLPATEEKFRGLIDTAEVSQDTAYLAQLMTQIARVEGLQRRFDEAHTTLDAVEELLADEMIVARIRYLLERGRVFNSSGKVDESKSLFVEAMEVALANKKSFYAVDAAHMMGIVELPEKQLEWSEKAMAIAETSNDEKARGWLGALYNNIGWTYHDLEQYDEALGLFQKGLEWRQERNDEQGTRIAKWTIGRTYRSLGRIEEAIQIQRALEQEIDDKGLERDGYVYEELGECLLFQGSGDEAAGHFRMAYELLSQDQWLVSNESERLQRLKDLGFTQK